MELQSFLQAAIFIHGAYAKDIVKEYPPAF
jgi:hypothetical protein